MTRGILSISMLVVGSFLLGLGLTEPEPTKASFDGIETFPIGLDKLLRKIPADNPLTPAKVELGRHLYFDKRLSADDTIACASCHASTKGWSNGERFATGVGGKVGDRSSPTIINRVFSEAQFWDGRAASLEAQALGPIENPIEMNLKLTDLIPKLQKIAGYKPFFKDAFGDEEINLDRIAKAIASFERTIVSGNSPYDRFENGETAALSDSEKRGFELFFDNEKGRCSICHAGPNLSDEKFHNLGVGLDSKEPGKHMGRFDITNDKKDRSSYKTPTLRNIADTAPYMHDGSEATLEEVVEFYARGGVPNPQLDRKIRKLDLSDQDKKDLVAFMKALTGEVTAASAPEPVK